MLTASYPAPTPGPSSGAVRALCIFLALCAAGLTAWWTVIGIQATEPDSPARFAKVVTGCFLLAVELAAFGLAASGDKNRGLLRALGVAVLVVDIAIMSIAQIAIGTSAHKGATAGAGTVAQLEQSIASKRQQAAALRESAAGNARSQYASSRRAGEASLAKAERLEREADDQAAKLAALRGEAVGTETSVIEIVGETGLIVLSIALSVLLSLSGIVLMHHAGGMWRRAGAADPAAAPAAPGALPDAARVVPLKRGDGRWALAAGAGLAAFSAAAPSPSQAAPMTWQATVPTTGRGVSLTQATDPAVSAQTQGGVSAQTHPGVSVKPKKAPRRAKTTPGAKVDTGTGERDGSRFARVREAVLAGRIKPSIRGIQDAEGGGAPVIRGYLAALEAEGIIERTPAGTYRRAA